MFFFCTLQTVMQKNAKNHFMTSNVFHSRYRYQYQNRLFKKFARRFLIPISISTTMATPGLSWE